MLQRLRWFAGRNDPLESICPFRLRDPLAPALAARREGVDLDIEQIARLVTQFATTCEVGLIEGAGGLLVPLAGRATFADLAALCGLRVLVVVGNRLGCVNHAALTIRWAETAGLDLAGYVINTLQPEPDLAMETNVELLHDTLGPSLGVFPWVGETVCSEADRTVWQTLPSGHYVSTSLSLQREGAKTRSLGREVLCVTWRLRASALKAGYTAAAMAA